MRVATAAREGSSGDESLMVEDQGDIPEVRSSRSAREVRWEWDLHEADTTVI